MELISLNNLSTTDQIYLVQNNIYKTINLGIIAHVDHGKTTLTDNLLCGVNLMTKENVGSCFLDQRHDEVERRITMKFSLVPCVYDTNIIKHIYSRFDQKFVYTKPEQIKVNILDSPGHIDFINEVCQTARCVDCAILVVDFIEGLQSQTVNVLRIALAHNIHLTLFINKLDRALFDLQVDARELQRNMKNLIDLINDTMKSLITEIHGENTDASENIYEEQRFDPARNNVVFGSSKYGWGFNMKQFSLMISSALGFNPRELCNQSFGNQGIVNKKLKNLDSINDINKYKPIFVDVLEKIQKMNKLISDQQNNIITMDEFMSNPFLLKLNMNLDTVKSIILYSKTELNKKLMSYWLPLNVTIQETIKSAKICSDNIFDNGDQIKHCLFFNKDVAESGLNTGFQLQAMFRNKGKDFNIQDELQIQDESTGKKIKIDNDLYYQMGNSLIKTSKVAANELFYIKSNDIIYKLCENNNLQLCKSDNIDSNQNINKPNLQKQTKYLKIDPLQSNILNLSKIDDLPKIKQCLHILKSIDGSFEYGVSDFTGELYLNTYGNVHLDKLKQDIDSISNSLFGAPFEMKISMPRFKFKEYVLETLDGAEVDGQDNVKITSKEHKFNSNVSKDLSNGISGNQNDDDFSTNDVVVNHNGYKMNIKVSRLELEVVNKLHDKPPKVVLSTLFDQYKNQFENYHSYKKWFKILKQLNEDKYINCFLGPDKALVNLLIFNNVKNQNFSNIDFSELRDKVVLAFHQLCLHGPIVAEQLLGVVFIVEYIEFHNDPSNKQYSTCDKECETISETNSTVHTMDVIETFGKFARTSLTAAFEKSHLALLEAQCRADALLPEKQMNTVQEVAAKHKGNLQQMDWYSDLQQSAVVAVPIKESLQFIDEIKNRTSGKVIPMLDFDEWRLVRGTLKWEKTEADYEEWGELEKFSEAMQLVKQIQKSKNMKNRELLVEEGTKQRTLTKNK